MYKIETQEENGLWHDVRGSDDQLLTFETESEAHAQLAALYPVLVAMEKYAGPKRTRVISIWTDAQDADWNI